MQEDIRMNINHVKKLLDNKKIIFNFFACKINY